jgi:CheY-like chemotaxis protein
MNTFNQEHLIEQFIPFILIVDDDQDDQMLLKMAFEETLANLSLHFVCNAKETLDYLQQAPDHKLPNLIVLDYNLPGVNGISLKQQLNSMDRYKGIEKVILSGSEYFPASSKKNFQPQKSFLKPHSFERFTQLAEQLLQLCIKKMHIQV